jgi:transposase InsO family protein
MGRPACPYDNAVMESFFATLKTECFGERMPRNRAEARALLFDYIETFYNPNASTQPWATFRRWNSNPT